MRHRFFTSNRFFTAIGGLVLAIAVALPTPVPAAGQSTPSATKPTKATPAPATKAQDPPRTADGRPDLQGVWDYRTITPLERPSALGTKEFFTAEEAANYEKDENQRQNRDLIDPERGGLQYPPGGVVPYNEFWYDRGNKIAGSRRTSLIVDPPDGRLPAWTPEGQRLADLRAEANRQDQLGHPHADSWEDRPLQERCILGFNSGPPMIPGAYNNDFQLFQTPGYVVILNEMVHDARIVPWMGARTGAFVSGRETRAATGREIRWSSTRRISNARRASTAPARTRT